MNAKKAVTHAAVRKTSSREAVENAISKSKGPRSTTWDDLLKKDGNRGWDSPKDSEGVGKQKAA